MFGNVVFQFLYHMFLAKNSHFAVSKVFEFLLVVSHNCDSPFSGEAFKFLVVVLFWLCFVLCYFVLFSLRCYHRALKV